MRPDDREVLEALALSLDPAAVLGRFPDLGREGLRRVLREAASRVPAAATGEKSDGLSLVAYIDGAARGNPGEAGAGVILKDGAGNMVDKIAFYLGRATNNTAEYRALLLALRRARELGAAALQVYSDSELLVHQINGRYRVRVPHLQELCQEAIRLMRDIGRVNVSHVPRERNTEADEQANRAIDQNLKA